MAKKSLFENKKSSAGGGGTVFFVTSDSHRYLKVIYNFVSPNLTISLLKRYLLNSYIPRTLNFAKKVGPQQL